MSIRGSWLSCAFLTQALLASVLQWQAFAQSSPAQPPAHPSQSTRRMGHPDSPPDAGSVDNGIYRNKNWGFSCKIPVGWVLRTEEMSARVEEEQRGVAQTDDPKDSDAATKGDPQGEEKAEGANRGRVLLAAFSRPPEARGEDVNSSILIAAESAAAYTGLKEAAQYFGPLTEIALAQGFIVVNPPYEFPVGTKTLARADFQKDVGKRVMRQSTLVMLARGQVVSFTFIGGTDEEVDALVKGLTFTPAGRPPGK